MSAHFDSTLEEISRTMPKPYQHVIVVTSHYTCLGFVDSSGKWYSAANHSRLKKVVKWQHLSVGAC